MRPISRSKTVLLSICWVLLILQACCFASETKKNVNYRCQGPEKSVLTISYQGSRAEVKEVNPKSGKTEVWVLPTLVNISDKPRSPIRFYTTYSPSVSSSVKSPFFEVREQFFLEGPEAEIRLGLIKEGLPLSKWKCVTTGFSAKVKLLETVVDLIPGEKLWVEQVPKGFVTEDKLSPESFEWLDYSVFKYTVWREKLDAPTFKRAISESCRSLANLSPKALPTLVAKWDSSKKSAWEEIMREIDYRNSSPLQRWLFWASLLKENNREMEYGMAYRERARLFEPYVANPVIDAMLTLTDYLAGGGIIVFDLNQDGLVDGRDATAYRIVVTLFGASL